MTSSQPIRPLPQPCFLHLFFHFPNVRMDFVHTETNFFIWNPLVIEFSHTAGVNPSGIFQVSLRRCLGSYQNNRPQLAVTS
ncbi:hypothetical protein CW304_32280 [Bacillus sp. UFRGS-B20]|nr:hypothetical protein CW304_32280 [Bacillus sp. UFRGS-B20]